MPDANRMGEPGDGWRVAVTTLMNERVSLGGATTGFALPFERLAAVAAEHGADPTKRDRLVRVYTQNRILEFLQARIVAKLGRGQIPTAEGSIMKLVLASLVSDSAEPSERYRLYTCGVRKAVTDKGTQERRWVCNPDAAFTLALNLFERTL